MPFSLFLTLPWPKPILSPNARAHWRDLAREKARFRESSRLATLLALKRRRPLATDIYVSLYFTPPDRRAYDQDNLLARMKAGLDGVAEALGVDDSRFRFTHLEILGPQRPPMVRVHLSETQPQEVTDGN